MFTKRTIKPHQAVAVVDTASEAPVSYTHLDVYKRQDEQVSTPDMQEYGYSYDGMFPVTRERALELDAAGLTVYVDVYKRQGM